MFTKGEWKVDPLSDEHAQMVITEDDGLIADCFENKANAQLISASPELYEAVRWVLEDHREGKIKLNVSTHTKLLNVFHKAGGRE